MMMMMMMMIMMIMMIIIIIMKPDVRGFGTTREFKQGRRQKAMM